MLCFLLMAARAMAQWDVPGPLVLDGGSSAQRQILGLGAPLTTDAAVSLDDLRSVTVSRATAEGDVILTADLFPAPSAYVAGMVVQITPVQSNASAAQLNINGLGAQPMVKWGGVPLDSADLRPGIPVRLVYDGERFLLLGDTRLNCPAGYVTTSAAFCIEALPHNGADFFEANLQCAASGGRLCSFAEWSHACRTVPGFMTTVLEIEWVDEAANNTNYAKIMGIGEDGSNGSGTGCTFGGIRLPTNVNSFRCCTSR
ncbi:MAG: hypothetical protein ABI432_12540 [Flavobacteriales bacterium]